MGREVQDGEGVRWTCVQAYEGLQELAGDAARVEGTNRFRTVCTPSGGQQSVEVELDEGWEEKLEDEELLQRIQRKVSAGD